MPTLRAVCFLPLLAAACGKPQTWTPVAAEAFTPAQQKQAERADAARATFSQTLMDELTKGLAQGPAAAIQVCSEAAPRVAATKSAELGVRLGRTSLSLRNQGNTAPAWAAEHVRTGNAAPTWFAGSAGELGALFPIRLMPQCVQCHGSKDQLGAGVADALAKRYPQDQATGFRAGDLRGWFWVEVPGG